MKLSREILENSEIINKTIIKGRWEVTLRFLNISLKIPHAHYVWLKENPSFNSIPGDYIIHHLDNDPLNDDISNLVLMYKFHHMAYHTKFKNKIVKVDLNDNDTYGEPTQLPHIRKNGKNFYIDYASRDDKEKYKQRKIFSWKGKILDTEKKAQALISMLWPDKPWEFNLEQK